jgi:hypothetical protein
LRNVRGSDFEHSRQEESDSNSSQEHRHTVPVEECRNLLPGVLSRGCDGRNILLSYPSSVSLYTMRLLNYPAFAISRKTADRSRVVPRRGSESSAQRISHSSLPFLQNGSKT